MCTFFFALERPDWLFNCDRQLGYWSHPIFSREGDYPDVVKKVVDRRSKMEGRPRSRLVPFTKEEVEYIRGTPNPPHSWHFSPLVTHDWSTVSPPRYSKSSAGFSSVSLHTYIEYFKCNLLPHCCCRPLPPKKYPFKVIMDMNSSPPFPKQLLRCFIL